MVIIIVNAGIFVGRYIENSDSDARNSAAMQGMWAQVSAAAVFAIAGVVWGGLAFIIGQSRRQQRSFVQGSQQQAAQHRATAGKTCSELFIQ